MKKTMKIYMAAALLAVVSPAILAQAPVKVVCNELKQKETGGDRRRDHGRR